MLSNGNILCYEKKKCAFLFSVAVGKQAIRTDQETQLFNCLFYFMKKKMCIAFLSSFRIISDY